MTIDTASAISQVQVQNQLSIAVAKKSLDAAKQQGEAALQLIEAAAAIGQQQSHSESGRLDVVG